ncbi:MAG: O-methyltransferase [Nitrososphaerales archaeon]|nr:O-methyltransferase [Nitrososphaerales archaeon]
MNPDEVLRSIEAIAPSQGLPIIGPVRGALLDEVVMKEKPKRILEVGTLVGYSAIRMGRLLPRGGRITCVEMDERIAKVAASNIQKAGLEDRIEILLGDAKRVIPTLKGELDLVFIDAEKSEYLTYLKGCERLLHKGSIVVADNVKAFAEKVADYLDYVRNSGSYTSTYRESSLDIGTSVTDAVEISVKK